MKRARGDGPVGECGDVSFHNPSTGNNLRRPAAAKNFSGDQFFAIFQKKSHHPLKLLKNCRLQ